ncbi:MAG: DUF4870 domain-containing protein [Janthinobacterium lividum]
MDQDQGAREANQDGAEPVYGPAYTARQAVPGRPDVRERVSLPPVFNGPEPPYTAPYPPYPSDVPYTTPIPVHLAAALAYLLAPAVVFLLLPAYRSQSLVRFHSWQAIFYFIVAVAVREVEQLLVSMLPSAIAFTVSGLLLLILFAGWMVAAIKALQGEKWLLPVIGAYAERTASTTSLPG